MDSQHPIPKRRWWQFSLRTFAVVVALLAVLLVGFLRLREHGRWAQREVIYVFLRGEDKDKFNRDHWFTMWIYGETRDWRFLDPPARDTFGP